MKKHRPFLSRVASHPISIGGAVLTTVTGCGLLLLLVVETFGASENVYATGFLLLALPVLFFFGLLLIPLGLWLGHRRERRAGEPRPLGERIAALFTTRAGYRTLALIGVLTLVNIILLGAAGTKAAHYMDSPTFCGMACHTVMQPEYDSYKASPHARVRCVQCHIGPGASFAVRSKVDGLRQVWRTITDTYDRPVPVPVHTLRPSRDTCEQCHWPDKFHGNPVAQRTHIGTEEDNPLLLTALLLNVGGRNEATGEYEGIHWHVSSHVQVRYEALDERREVIGKVQVLRDGEVVKEYLPPEEAGPVVETRIMDCIDCHNRPTHVFDPSPARALDRAFGAGLLDREVPWLRKLAEPLLANEAHTHEGVEADFRRELEAAYANAHPDAMPEPAVLDASAASLADLWRANVFPERKVGWGTYPSHLGHQGETPERHGCFRCHNGDHETADGESMSQDCELCHQLLALEEAPDDLEESLQILLGYGEE